MNCRQPQGKTPCHQFKPHQADGRDDELAQPEFDATMSSRKVRANLKSDSCPDESDCGNSDARDPYLRRRHGVSCRHALNGRRSGPVPEPEEDSQAAENRTRVLEKCVNMHHSQQGKRDSLQEERPVARGPMVGVGEGVPQEMGQRSDQDGRQNKRKLQRLPERERIRVGGNSLASGARQQCGRWLFDHRVKKPINDEPHRQAKKEEAPRGVTEGTSGGEPEEEFQIRSERTNNKRRQNQASSPEGVCGRSMSQCEGHSSYYCPWRGCDCTRLDSFRRVGCARFPARSPRSRTILFIDGETQDLSC